jgi:hypothetical protein
VSIQAQPPIWMPGISVGALCAHSLYCVPLSMFAKYDRRCKETAVLQVIIPGKGENMKGNFRAIERRGL